MVCDPRAESGYESAEIRVYFLYGGTLSDADVYAGQNSGYTAAEYAGGHRCGISGLWRRYGGVYVFQFCPEYASGDRRGGQHRWVQSAADDSVDVWANPELFQLDENRTPTAVSGCPPDAFSADGQLWGNPLYDWEYHKKTGYRWWIDRLKAQFELFDIVRIDHFRGFDAYYSIPYGDTTAVNGHWERGVGIDLFAQIKKELGEMPIIAEDLGYVTDTVKKLLEDTGYPGMKVLQFAFDSREAGCYMPYKYPTNSVVYTGTHDNDTIVGWYQNIREEDRKIAQAYLNNADAPKEKIPWDYICCALSCVADTCIIPVQDYLGLGSGARINTPSVASGNWKWRMKQDAFSGELCERIRFLAEIYGRC